ncbi:MAG: hypothetical protein ACI4RN_01540 [Oscillospiraceae bacterium]
MVSFRLIEENELYIIYWYFPNGNEDSGHGTIVINVLSGNATVTELAPDDFSREVSITEQNELLDSLNQMRIDEGLEMISEDELLPATQPFTKTFFADHAIEKIMSSYSKGTILKNGVSIWY